MNKRAILVGLLCGGVIASAVTGGALCASAATVAPSFAIKETASIRTKAPTGIRFETTILKTEYEALKDKDPVYGTVVNAKALVGENELVLGAEGAVNVEATNWKLEMKDDEQTTDIDESQYNQYNAVLVGEYDEETGTWAGLPQEAYGVKLVARSYVTYTDENGARVTEYGENKAVRSISDVAKGAIMDTVRQYEPEEYEYFHAITDYVAEQNAMNAVSVNVALETLNATVPVSAEFGAVQAVYAVSGENYTALENGSDWTYADGNLTFTDAFLKSLAYGDYTLKVFAEKDVFELPTTIYGESTLGYARTLGFDSSKTVSTVKYQNEAEWLPEYEGAKGVMKFTTTDTWAGLQLAMPYKISELQAMEWDYFEIRVLTEMSADIYEGTWPTVTQGKWGTIKLSKADVVTIFGSLDAFYGKLVNGITNNERLFAFWNAGTFYIDHIDFKCYNTDGVFDFSDPTSNNDMLLPANAEWISSFGDVNGVVKGTYTGEYSATITLRGDTTLENLQALSWEVLVVRVWFEETEANASSSKPDPVKANWNINGLGTGPRGKWVSLCISKENLAAQFGDMDTFYTKFISSSGALLTEVYNTQNSCIYVDSVNFVNYDRTMDFETEDEISFLCSGTDAQWFESATCDKGRTASGVLSYNHGTKQYGGIRFNFNNWTGMVMDDWDTMKIRIRILRGPENGNPGTDASFGTLYLSNDYTWSGGVDNGWSELTISKDAFINCGTWGNSSESVGNFWQALNDTYNGERGARVLFESWYLHTQGGWGIQIDYISLVKNS